MTKTATKPAFELVEVGTADEVPAWSRQPKKYDEIAQRVMQMKVGERAAYRFVGKDEKEARKLATRAVNTVRDQLNSEASIAMHEGGTPPVAGLVKTRVEMQEDGSAKAHIYVIEYPQEMRPQKKTVTRQAGKK
jgi:hypothetical protein